MSADRRRPCLGVAGSSIPFSPSLEAPSARAHRPGGPPAPSSASRGPASCGCPMSRSCFCAAFRISASDGRGSAVSHRDRKPEQPAGRPRQRPARAPHPDRFHLRCVAIPERSGSDAADHRGMDPCSRSPVSASATVFLAGVRVRPAGPASMVVTTQPPGLGPGPAVRRSELRRAPSRRAGHPVRGPRRRESSAIATAELGRVRPPLRVDEPRPPPGAAPARPARR